jgi:hypothetical protein
MKAFFLTGAIIMTVLILILAFENMGVNATGFLFVFTPLDSPFFMIMGLCLVGIVAGVFYTGLLMNLLGSGKEDEEAPGNEW